MTAQELTRILNLDVAQRIWLVQQIWDSLLKHPESIPLPNSQKEELDKRLDAHYNNPGAGSSWTDVKDRILADY